MKRKSWIALGVSLVLAICLGALYLLSQSAPEKLTQEQAVAILSKMQVSFEKKSVSGVVDHVTTDPHARLANLTPDQVHLMLANYFRNSERLHTEATHQTYSEGPDENLLQFDLSVRNDSSDSKKEDYQGRITLHFRRVETPRLLGLMHANEWRITGVDTTGPDPSTFGMYEQ